MRKFGRTVGKRLFAGKTEWTRCQGNAAARSRRRPPRSPRPAGQRGDQSSPHHTNLEPAIARRGRGAGVRLADCVLLAPEEVAAGYRRWRGRRSLRRRDRLRVRLDRARATLPGAGLPRLASDGRVWVIDPVADELALESARELGEPAGVVQLLDRPARPSSRLAAARKTRSLSSSRGQEIWRRSTASSWRSTTISSFLNSRDRKRSAATASARRNNRCSNDTTTKQPPSTRVRGARHYGCDSAPQRSRPTGWICAPDRLDTHVVELDPVLLVNVNTVADLLALTP